MVLFFLMHYETYIPIDFIKLQHWHCHFEHLYYVLLHILIYLCMNWIYCMPNTFLYEKLIDSSRPTKTENYRYVTYISSITAGMSFFCSCRLKILLGKSNLSEPSIGLILQLIIRRSLYSHPSGPTVQSKSTNKLV